MSIYQSQAPLWIAATDDLNPLSVEVLAQVVPAWIGHPDYHGYYPTDPYAGDLPPPPADPEGDIPRAVVLGRHVDILPGPSLRRLRPGRALDAQETMILVVSSLRGQSNTWARGVRHLRGNGCCC